MPESLGYARGALDELRARYGELSREELLELVCSLTKEYVLDQTIPFDFPHPERAEAMRGDRPDAPAEEETTDPSEVQFARLISGLKARTQLPQFDDFEVEDGKAVLIVDNQKVVFGERVTVSLFSRRGGRAPAPAPSRSAPGRSAPGQSAPGQSAPAPSRSAPSQPSRPAPAASRPSGLPPGPFENRGGGPAEPPRRILSLDEEPARSAEPDVDFDDSGVERFGGLDLD